MATASVDVTSSKARHLRNPRPRNWRASFTDSIVGIPPQTATAFIAFSVMAAFPKKTPQPGQLMQRFDMSRATAYRYVAALKAVRGEV